MRLAVLTFIAFLTAGAAHSQAAMLSATLDAEQLGAGKNTIYYFESGGILFGHVEAREINRVDFQTPTGKVIPMRSLGEPTTSDRKPPGAIDAACTKWRERCWTSEILKFNVCTTRCVERKDADSGETRVVEHDPSIFLTIASDVVKLR